MSRAHMIYNETSHDAEVHNVAYSGASTGGNSWSDVTNKDDTILNGDGFVLEGKLYKIPDRVIVDKKHRYSLLYLEYINAFKRRFEDGTEIEAVKKDERQVLTGYLGKTKTETRADYAMSAGAVQEKSRPLLESLKLPVSLSAASHRLLMLGTEELVRPLGLVEGVHVRLKSFKDSCLIESIGVVDTTTKMTTLNFTGGEATGEGWTDKLMRKGVADSGASGPVPGDELQGCDDDEWDD
eukprot:m.330505 g.330505  ORF g.330505 m.330505 type:complete len:239 (+) comp20462_c0_seq4:307-1023(+)